MELNDTILSSGLLTDDASLSHGSFCVSALCYRQAENVGIAAVVVSPFELRDVQREVFAADLVVLFIIPRFKSDRKPSMVCVWTAPLTYWGVV